MRNIQKTVIGLLFAVALFAMPALAAESFAVVQKFEGTKAGSGVVFDVSAGSTLTIPVKVTGGTPPYTVTWTVYYDDRSQQAAAVPIVTDELKFTLENFRPQDRGYYCATVKDSTGKTANTPFLYANWKR